MSSAVCAIAVGALAGWYSWQQQKLRLGQNLVATSRALIQSADRELEQSGLALRAVASSVNFHKGNFSELRDQVSELVQPYGYFLVITEPGASREIINTATSSGSPLPELPSNWRTAPTQALETEVKPLSRIAEDKWAVALQMLASTDAGSKYLLTIAVPASRFQRVIDNQRLPPEWSPVILDKDWTIVARAPDKFIGQRGANYELKDVLPLDSVYEAHVLEGYATVHARSRSEKFGWTVAVAVPKAFLTNEFLGPAVVAGLSGFAIALLAAGAIILFSARLGQDIDSLSSAATALAEHKEYSLPQFQIRELAAVAKDLKHAAERLEKEETFRKRVVDELAHRLRNKVATIQAILGYELREHSQLRKEIFGRLAALAATDDLILTAQGRGADLGEIVRAELAPYQGSRVSAEGPKTFLEPKLALTLALVLHELATNASKYGAISGIAGRVAVRWSIADSRLNLEWHESDGPIVVKPERQGFGSRLVTGILASFGGKIDARFEPTGLICNVSVDLAKKTSSAFSEDSTVLNGLDVDVPPPPGATQAEEQRRI
jgi:two-component sensor histidine kinase